MNPKESDFQLDDDPRKFAARNNLDMLVPKDDEVFIDIDSDADLDHYLALVDVLKANDISFISETKMTTSRSGGTHVYMKLQDGYKVDAIGRIALQAVFGSDRKRELLGLLRVVLKCKRPPTVFFEVPDGEDDILF